MHLDARELDPLDYPGPPLDYPGVLRGSQFVPLPAGDSVLDALGTSQRARVRAARAVPRAGVRKCSRTRPSRCRSCRSPSWPSG